MNELPPAMPSNPIDGHHRSRSARWTGGFVVAVGFAFMGSALIDASEPGIHAVGSRPSMVEPTAMDVNGPTAGHAESYEVDVAVRNWVWETRTPERQPARAYDIEELWLAR